MHCDLLIKNGFILPQPRLGTMIANGFVAIRGTTIKALGPMAELGEVAAAKTIDAAGCLVMPGLVNGHVHGAMTLFRGLADDLPLMEWLEGHIFPAESRYVNEEMVYWSTKLAAAEMLLGGVTLLADSYFCMDGAARAYAEIGMRAVAAHGVIDFPAPGVADPSRNLDVVADYCQRWQGHSLLTPAVFAHSPYTCSAGTLQGARKLAQEQGVDLYIHLGESKFEAELIRADGLSPTAYLDSLGVLDDGVVAIHCVWLTGADMDILASRGCRVVSCPESNMKLASGVAPVAALHERGIAVGLGTDGCASNNNLDMFSEMGSVARLAKVDCLMPEILPASQVLQMATTIGATVLGQQGLGSLAPGAKADCIVIDLYQPHLTPFYNSDLLVYGAKARDVRDVVVDGQLVVQDRLLLSMDVAEVMDQVRGLAATVREGK